MDRVDAFVFGVVFMYAIAGAYIGWMLPVKRRGVSMILCAAIWPLMLLDVQFVPSPEKGGQ